MINILYLRANDLHPNLSTVLPPSHKRCEYVSRNIVASDAYWRLAFHEFKASSMQQLHIDPPKTPKLFHTGSLAEYHEYDLKCVLATYVSQLTNKSRSDAAAVAKDIMTNDAAFVRAVQSYKHVVTHYFAAKTEIWMAPYMKPVFGVTGGNLANEFAASRGAIHCHSVLQAMHPSLDVGGEELRKYAMAIKDAMKLVDNYIQTTYLQEHHLEFPTKPNTVFNLSGLDLREQFCKLTDNGNQNMKVRPSLLMN